MKRNITIIGSVLLIISLCFSSVLAVSAQDTASVEKYELIIYDKYDLEYVEWDGDGVGYYYEEYYHYYRNEATCDEATPDYVLLLFDYNVWTDHKVEYVGPYAILGNQGHIRGTLGYHIYVPAEDKLYSLREAYEASIDEIDRAFTDSGIRGFYMSGDADENFVIDIKDATYIQKVLAYIIHADLMADDEAKMDFNRDRRINIKDATAIQKHIAGLEY